MKASNKHAMTKNTVTKVLLNDKDIRIARMEAYIKNTHSVFLYNLELVDKMSIFGNGVLAGPVAKQRKNDVAAHAR